MKPSTMRAATGMAFFGRSTTASPPEITLPPVWTERTTPGPSRPVFVDASGRRGRLLRPLGITLNCILAVPIILAGAALATDVGLPSVPWPTAADGGAASVTARTSVARVARVAPAEWQGHW